MTDENAPSYENMPLEGPALDLWNKVRSEWELDTVAERLLRNACESLMQANNAAAICRREGLTIPDRFGRPSKHPASLLERDHRAQCSQTLMRLGLNLQR